jgi:glycerol-3-phosphate acyltransferase PlsY
MLLTITALLISYLVGSIPTAFLFAKTLKGIDIRKVGSGNVGATNAMRALGKGPALAVLFLDIVKGVLPVTFLGNFFQGSQVLFSIQELRILMGLACICGHIWTVFLQFKGGKGIATSFGVLLGLALQIPGLLPVIGLLILVWFAVFLIFRIVSLASISAAAALPVMAFLFKLPLMFSCITLLLSFFTIFKHKANLARIFKGQEPRLYFKKTNK